MLLNSDGRAGVGARCRATGGEARRVHLSQVFVGRVPLQGQLHVEVLGDGRVHDATCQDVGETAVIAGTPVVKDSSYKQNIKIIFIRTPLYLIFINPSKNLSNLNIRNVL